MENLVLRVLYLGVASQAIFMLFWMTVVPGSLRNAWAGKESKYSGQYLVQFTHILPAAVWSLAIIFQLHPGFRKKHRQWHRRMGYACLTSAVAIAFGFAVIEYRQLDWIHRDFGDIPLDEAVSGLGFGWINPLLFLRCVAILFLSFAGLALRAILRGDFVTHRKWILRHIGMGLWIAGQRIYVVGRSIFAAVASEPLTRRESKEIFTDGIYVGMAFTVLGAELGVWMYARQQKKADMVATARLLADESR